MTVTVSIPNVPSAFSHQTCANNSFHNIPQPHFACIFANRNCDAEPEFTSVISYIYIYYILYIYYIYYIYISSENFINPKFDGFETDQMTDQWSLLATRTNISRQLPDVDF